MTHSATPTCQHCGEIHSRDRPCLTWSRPARGRGTRATGPLPAKYFAQVLDGRYRIMAVQRDGDYALIGVAQQLSVGRSVTLAWATEEMTKPMQKAWLRRARAAARLHHPTLTGVLDIGEAEGRPFVVSEYLDGGNIGTRLIERGLPSADEFKVFSNRILGALTYAHAKGLQHRDLRVQSVRFAQDGASERLKIVGWTNPADLPLIHDASPDRMMARAPERLSDPSAGGIEVDVYAAAALLHRVATGGCPFPGAGRDLQHNMLSVAPISLRSHRSDLPDRTDRALRAALSADPAKRPGSIKELQEMLATAPARRAQTRRLKAASPEKNP